MFTFKMEPGFKKGKISIEEEGPFLHVIYHETVIVRWDRTHRTVKLDSGGWKNVITRRAINHALRQVSRDMILLSGWKLKKGKDELKFTDGMEVEL